MPTPQVCIQCSSPTMLPHLCPLPLCRPAHIRRLVGVPSLMFALSTVESARLLTASPPSARIDLGPARPIGPSPGARSSPPVRFLDSPHQRAIQRLADLMLRYQISNPVAQALDTFKFAPPTFREFHATLRRQVDHGWLLCDAHPPATWFAGVCSAPLPGPPGSGFCEQDLYPRVGTLQVVCPRCHTRHDVIARRDALKGRLRGAVVHARLGASVLIPLVNADPNRPPTTLKQLVTKIYNWRQRGQLQPVAIDHAAVPARPLYELGDIIDCIWPPATA